MKSEPPSVKSERPPSVKIEPRDISLPGSSVGSSSMGSRTTYGGSISASSGSIGPALSGRTSYGGVSSVGSNQTPRRQPSTIAYLDLAGGKSAQTSQSGSMSNVTSLSSSRPVSVDADNVRSNSYRPFPVSERPRRDDVLRAGRTFEVPEKRPGYVAETRARRRL
jgi:hypothetical protein